MTTAYDPAEHIRLLGSAPRPETILDQRDVTIHSYVTTLPFDRDDIAAGLERAWLSPAIQLGGYSHPIVDNDSISIVLGLQGDLPVRAYDFDGRRSLWFAWRGTIVETRAVRYFQSEDGYLCFSTAGGGVRITDDRLDEFNSTFLKIPKGWAHRLQFDLRKLRQLCFGRFADHLYMLRFSDPSSIGYKSIDSALFQSREFIEPDAQRFLEIKEDPDVKVQGFDSTVRVSTAEVAGPVDVRFAVRGPSGALRLRFPKVSYRSQPSSGEAETVLFYRLVDTTMKAVLDDDYYARQRLSVAEVEQGNDSLDLFPELTDTAGFRAALQHQAALSEFFAKLDLMEPKHRWLPPLIALDELLATPEFPSLLTRAVFDLVQRDHRTASRLLQEALDSPRLVRLGSLVCRILSGEVQEIPAGERAYVEGVVLSWLVAHEGHGWDVDLGSEGIIAGSLRFSPRDLGLDALAKVLWKLMGVLHGRLMAGSEDAGQDLAKFAWCVTAAAALSPNQEHGIAALKLIASGRVPRKPAEASQVLKVPVRALAEMDSAVLEQFGLPLWPLLSLRQGEAGPLLSNDGIGAALRLTLTPSQGARRHRDEPVDLRTGESLALPQSTGAHVGVTFQKFGVTRAVALTAEQGAPARPSNVRSLPKMIQEKRLREQREARARIDPAGVVIGSSPALLEVFGQIQQANEIQGLAAVLLLGESGAGKTHVARLIHDSSPRAKRLFAEISAGGTGGDPTVQRGEWVGYGRKHGFQGVEPEGRLGHISRAQGGTLFIDEFASFSTLLQDVFLSVLESRPIQKAGGESFIPDVRCVFATNADVDDLAGRGVLRSDLLARIAVRIRVPSLRERRGDILLLARHFSDGVRFTEETLIALVRHDWPNNVRELSATIKKAVARRMGSSKIELDHVELPDSFRAQIEALPGDACRRELWALADEVARAEGFKARQGLQRRAGEIMGVQEAQASKMYAEFGLGLAESA